MQCNNIAFRASVTNDDRAMLGQCPVREVEPFQHDVLKIHIYIQSHFSMLLVSVSLSLPHYGIDMLYL